MGVSVESSYLSRRWHRLGEPQKIQKPSEGGLLFIILLLLIGSDVYGSISHFVPFASAFIGRHVAYESRAAQYFN